MSKSSIDLHVEGMTCAGCVARVIRALEKIPQVKAEVSLIEHRARVYGTDLSTAVAAIRQAGYNATPVARLTTLPAKTKADSASQSPHGLDIQNADSDSASDQEEFAKTWVAAIALIIMLVEMIAMTFSLGHHIIPIPIQAFLATVLQFWVGAQVARTGTAGIMRGNPNMESLIFLGTGSAYLWSIAVLVSGSELIIPSGLDLIFSAESPIYFEASVVVLSMLHLGRSLQKKAQDQTLAALAPFLAQTSHSVWRVSRSDQRLDALGPEDRIEVSAQDLQNGDRIWLGGGERLACDAIILEGSGEFDDSSLTGESLPHPRGPGDRLLAGTINLSAPVLLRVEGNPDQWHEARVRDQIMSALASKAPIAQWADRIAAIFVPCIAAIALANLMVQSVWGAGIAIAFERTIAILVIACPCALGLATPMAMAAGLARAAQKGWLFKNAASLQKVGLIEHIVFDKTGTLSEGRPRLLALESPEEPARLISTTDFPEWLALATAAQEQNSHPLAGAFWSQAAGRAVPRVDGHQTHVGAGVEVHTARGRLFVGHPRWVGQFAQIPPARRDWPWATQVEVAQEGQWLGRVWIADRLKPDATAAMDSLRALGIEASILSGDRREAVQAMADELKIPQTMAWASQTPEDKARRLLALRSKGQKVAMVGDGINDLAAMAHADVAIALSAGASATLKTADLTLANSHRLSSIEDVIRFSKRVRHRVVENLVFAFGFNLLALPLAALGILSPSVAGAAMALSSLAVVSNAARLLSD